MRCKRFSTPESAKCVFLSIVAPVEGYMVSIDTFNRFSFESFQVRCVCTVYSVHTVCAGTYKSGNNLNRKPIEWQTKNFSIIQCTTAAILWCECHRHTHVPHYARHQQLNTPCLLLTRTIRRRQRMVCMEFICTQWHIVFYVMNGFDCC